MAQLGHVFDASQVEPSTGSFGDLLPRGWVMAQIDDSEIKDTSTSSGKRLNLRFAIIDGDFKGRKAFHGLNIVNANPQAEQIAKAELSAICHAVGRLQVTDSAELHGLPLWIKVGVEKGGPKPEGGVYDDRNNIRAFKPASFMPPQGELMGADAGHAGGAAPANPFPGTASAAPANPFPAPVQAAAANPFPAPAAPTVPAAPAAPKTPPPPPVVQKSPAERLAEAGWTAHPDAAGYWYKGEEVKLEADALVSLAPAAPVGGIPAAPAAPAANSAPANTAAVAAAASATPPWATQQ